MDFSKISEPLERLARLTYQFFTGYFDDAIETGGWWGYFAHPYQELAREYQCDGAFLHPLITCRTATNHLIVVQDQLMKKLNIPSLLIEGDIVDLSLFDPADALRKAETFEETMDHYKKVRQEKGLSQQ